MTQVLEDVARSVFSEWVKDIPDARLASMVTYEVDPIRRTTGRWN